VSSTIGFAIIAISALSLAACATAPQPQRTDGRGTLKVCAMGVSNAPRMDARRYIIGYDAFAHIDGVAMARAPVAACLSSGFGPRRGGASNFHHGIDLFTRSPAAVTAGGGGIIVSANTQRGYGKTIVIRHNGRVSTRYAHLSSFAPGMSPGRRVRMGEAIGRTGASGNATAVHLHYEVLVNGKRRDPLSIGR